MTNRERARAVLNYHKYDRMPVVHFGYWTETLRKWCTEGHLKKEEIIGYGDNNPVDKVIAGKLGFDFNWNSAYAPRTNLMPYFASRVLETTPDGFRKVLNAQGVVVLQKDGAGSIPAEVDHLLKGRAEWEEHYLPKLQFSEERFNPTSLEQAALRAQKDDPYGIFCGSLLGEIRNWIGVEGLSYLQVDDEDLFDEIIDTVGNLCFKITETALKKGIRFDFGHFWEDICFKNGPLISPHVFYSKVGPYYRKITGLLKEHGVDLVSLDCDGVIDSLVPTWVENGVNIMFPMEVGTWNGNIGPMRERYGRELRGVGGMDKKVFAMDYAAVDREIERLRPLVELGGFIPCPDHRIPPDAKWENVQYYCEQMRKNF